MPRMKKICLTNDFHNTEVSLMARRTPRPELYEITAAQVEKARQTLCGIDGCSCGGFAGERGAQAFIVEGRGGGGAWITERRAR